MIGGTERGLVPRRPRFVLGRRASLLVAVAVSGQTLYSSAAPALTYRVFAQEWQLGSGMLGAVFAIYPVTVVATILVGRGLIEGLRSRWSMLLGLFASLVGALLFATARNVAWLFAARAVMGIGVGLAAGPSTAAVVAFSAPGRVHQAASLTTAAQAIGFAAALLVVGGLVQHGPWPLHVPFLSLAGGVLLLIAATALLRPDVPAPTPVSLRPQWPAVPAALRTPFGLAALAVMTAYTHGVVVLSLGGHVAHDLVGSADTLVNGGVLATFAVVSGIVGIVARHLPSRRAMALGAAASAFSMPILLGCIAAQSLGLYLLATAVAGAGYALLFLGALEHVTAAAPAAARSAVLSTLYLCAYLSMAVFAVGLGWLAATVGLGPAIRVGAAVIGAMSLGVVAVVLRSRRPRQVFRPVTPTVGERAQCPSIRLNRRGQ